MLQQISASIRKNWMMLYFSAGLAAIVFYLGYYVAEHHRFPYRFISGAEKTIEELTKQLKNEFPGLSPARYDKAGTTIYKPERVYPGVTLVGLPWKEGGDWKHSVRLVDMQGNILHKWTLAPEDLWPESPHDDVMRGGNATKLNTHIHGTVLLPKGEIVLNMSHYGMVKLNACSEVMWKVPRRAHHSVNMDEHGNFWAPGEKWHGKPDKNFPGFAPPFVEDTILQVSPDGELLREISILESLYKSGFEGLLFSFKGTNYSGDVTHNNDVEVLSTDLADDFDGLEAGDIMVSLRNIGTVLILDGKTEKVKWYVQHPLIKQHDPDFVAGGYITIFDNRRNSTGNAPAFGGSRIVRVKPFTYETEILFESSDDNYFYTQGGGKHQHLPNGNMLIGEPYGGRVFEVTKSGEVVWSWHAEHWAEGDDRVPEVHDGARYPLEYGNIPGGCSS